MVGPEFRMSFSDLGAFEREIKANIRYGRVFLSEVVDAPVLSEGVLVIVHPLHGAELRLPAQIVMVNSNGPMRGTGIALRAFGANDVTQVESFARTLEPPGVTAAGHDADVVGASVSEPAPEPAPATVPEPVCGEPTHADSARAADGGPTDPHVHERDELSPGNVNESGAVEGGEAIDTTQITVVPGAASPTLVPGAADEAMDDPPADDASSAEEHAEEAATEDDQGSENDRPTTPPELDPVAEPDPDASHESAASDDESADFDEDAGLGFDEDPGYDPEANTPGTPASTRQERLRALNAVEQLKVARKGELADRIVVERLYGKQVWEALLQNPRITLPEIARIARKGSVPRPLLEIIWENGSWTRDPSVRRALLSNPKLTADAIVKLLKQTPKHELKVLEKTTAYSMAVRDVARKLLRE